MDTQQAIQTRRATKHFDASYEIPEDEQRKLLSLAMYAPTAYNLQHWKLVVVDDPALRRELRSYSQDQSQVTDASMLIVICADLKAWAKRLDERWANAPEAFQEMIVPAVDAMYRGKARVERDEAMRSSGILAQTLMLAAESMGYQSCPMDGFDFEAVGKAIRLPEDHVIAMFVAIGKGTREPWPRFPSLTFEEVVVRDRFPTVTADGVTKTRISPLAIGDGDLESFELGELSAGLWRDEALLERGRGGITLVRSEPMTVVLENLRAGEELKEHNAPASASVLLLEGRATFASGQVEITMSPGTVAVFGKAVPHSLRADEDSSVLITIGDRESQSKEDSCHA